MPFQSVTPPELSQNLFDFIKLGMPLLTASDGARTNTMTVNWGQMGFLWNRCVATVYVRPQRFTYPIIEAAGGYSLCFMGDGCREQVAYCGRETGRDGDKIAHCGFTLAQKHGIPYFEEAQTVILCKKLYASWLEKDGFLDEGIAPRWYPGEDFHRVYTGEILEVLVREP